MTYDPAVPQSSESPSVFPGQGQANFGRLKTIIEADHQFNNTAQANDGYHNVIHETLQTPSGVLASTGRLYANTIAGRVHQFYMDDQGTSYQITPTLPIRAAVNFNGIPAIPTIRSSYNVTSVTKNSTGIYTITFTTAMPNTNYIVHVTGMRNSTSVCFGMVSGDATYGNSVKTGSVKVEWQGGGNSPVDVFMGNVTVYSVT